MDRASSWTQSQLLLPKEKNHISVLPFVTPYDPNLYQLTHIYIYIYLDSIGLTSIMINCYPNCSPSPPMVAYQCHRNLKEEFVHSKFWKLYHRHIYHLLGAISRGISFAILYMYIYIYIYIFSSTLTKRINTTCISTMEYLNHYLSSFLTYSCYIWICFIIPWLVIQSSQQII